jgi:hypothetical protein
MSVLRFCHVGLSMDTAMPAGNVAGPSHAEMIAAANGSRLAAESSLEPSLALPAATRPHHSNRKVFVSMKFRPGGR